MSAGEQRGAMIAFAVRAIEFARSRRSWFRAEEFAEAMECCKKSAYRWLESLESCGVVTRCGTQSGGYRWRRVA